METFSSPDAIARMNPVILGLDPLVCPKAIASFSRFSLSQPERERFNTSPFAMLLYLLPGESVMFRTGGSVPNGGRAFIVEPSATKAAAAGKFPVFCHYFNWVASEM